VIVVESEKSTIIASYYAPHYTWVACGGENGLTPKKSHALSGRDCLILFDCDSNREKVMKCAEIAANNIRDAGGRARVIDQYARFPGHEDGWDVADQVYSEIITGVK
jgi:Domain of unknown function (DUF6371)